MYGRNVVTYNLHLESRGSDTRRLRQLQEVLNDCRRSVGPSMFVIGGDFNMNAGKGDAAKALCDSGFNDAVRSSGRPTTPVHGSPRHGGAIDWIFVSGGLDSQGRVHDDVHESDHYPVSAAIATPRAPFSTEQARINSSKSRASARHTVSRR